MAVTITLGRTLSVNIHGRTFIDPADKFYWLPVKSVDVLAMDEDREDVFSLCFLWFRITYSRPSNPRHWELVQANKLRLDGRFLMERQG